VLALMQFGGATLLVVYFVLCSMLWIIAAWRPGLDPNLLRLIHDGSWLIFVMVFPAYTMQMISISLAGFMDKSAQPTFPRWFCYFNLWVGFAGMGGGLATFFTDGPFAWNGLIGFWIPVAMFALWLFTTAVLLKRAIERQALEAV